MNERAEEERDEVETGVGFTSATISEMTVARLIARLQMFQPELLVRVVQANENDEDNLFEVKDIVAGDSLHVELII